MATKIPHLKLDFDTYQAMCVAGGFYPGKGERDHREYAYLALGFIGEAGESVDMIKKILRETEGIFEDHVQMHRKRLIDELGDTMWYFANLLHILNQDFGELLHANQEKLKDRYPELYAEHIAPLMEGYIDEK